MKVPTLSLSAEALLPKTVFLVEATNFEELTLWKEWKDELSWQSASWGVLKCVGHLDSRLVMVSFKWMLLLGHPVLFYHATSEVVDYKMVDEWLKEHVPVMRVDGCLPRTDAGNFHICAHHVQRLGAVSPESEYATA